MQKKGADAFAFFRIHSVVECTVAQSLCRSILRSAAIVALSPHIVSSLHPPLLFTS